MKWFIIPLLTTAVLLVFFAGCDSRDTTSSTYSISVTSNPDTLNIGSANNYSTVSAVVTKDGESLEGVQVNFSTNFGNILGSAQTNNYGVAESTFWYEGNDTGVAKIRAEFAGVEAETRIYIVDDFPFILQVWSSPDTIYLGSNNYDTEIFASLTNRDGLPISNAQISFSAEEGFITPNSTTNANGIAEAVYIFTGDSEQLLDISASYQEGTSVCHINVVQLDIINLNVWAEPDTIYSGTNLNNAEIYAELKDGFGNPISDVQVAFSASLGSILNYAATDDYGIANSTFWYSERPDMIAVITAEYAGITDNTLVTILLDQPQIVFLEADPLVIYADNDSETYSIVTVRIFDSAGNPLADQPVNFQSALGYFVQPYAETNNSGYANTQFHDNGIPGLATVYVYCANDQSQIDIQIIPAGKKQ